MIRPAIMTPYCPKEIEAQCQQRWDEEQPYRVEEQSNKPKYYCLAMYPYPSGTLHMGHVRNYTLSDVDARFHRLLGYNVLHPIGWDSFGLPAENAAILHRVSPKVWTQNNIEQMKKQFKRLGCSFDWDRELQSHDPDYYKWEQEFFLLLYRDGLAYQKKRLVYWCPVDETVLANEQVEEGHCWRCGSVVETRALNQWFLRLTAFAKELLDGLEELPHWPKEVKAMQRHWIGEKKGVELIFPLTETRTALGLEEETSLALFTEHLEAIEEASHVAITAEHPLILSLMKKNGIWQETINRFLDSEGLEESRHGTNPAPGLRLPLEVRHPLTQNLLPLILVVSLPTGETHLPWLGIPTGVPADLQVARQFNLLTRECAETIAKGQFKPIDVNSDPSVKKSGIQERLEKLGIACKPRTVYRVKDWGISRQRYWGAPIPILLDEHHNPYPELELPVTLPEFDASLPNKNFLESAHAWKEVQRNGKTYHRLCETFDTFMESSWYYARYCSVHDANQMIDPAKANYWLPVNHYIGGIEHSTMHLMYFRFFYKLLHRYGLVQSQEPVTRLTCQGMVLSEAFYCQEDGKPKTWIAPSDVSFCKNETGEVLSATDPLGRPVLSAGSCKMSKSKNNGIDPETMIARYGADSVRLFILFSAPPSLQLQWSEQGVVGAARFLKRLWALGEELLRAPSIESLSSDLEAKWPVLQRKCQECIKKVTQAYGPRFTINVGIAAIMEFFNYFSQFVAAFPDNNSRHRDTFQIVLKLLHPVVPHITETLWSKFSSQSIELSGWPILSEEAQSDRLLVVQLNGKKIGCLKDLDKSKEECLALVLKDEKMGARLSREIIVNTIYIPGKILNLVTSV